MKSIVYCFEGKEYGLRNKTRNVNAVHPRDLNKRSETVSFFKGVKESKPETLCAHLATSSFNRMNGDPLMMTHVYIFVVRCAVTKEIGGFFVLKNY